MLFNNYQNTTKILPNLKFYKIQLLIVIMILLNLDFSYFITKPTLFILTNLLNNEIKL